MTERNPKPPQPLQPLLYEPPRRLLERVVELIGNGSDYLVSRSVVEIGEVVKQLEPHEHSDPKLARYWQTAEEVLIIELTRRHNVRSHLRQMSLTIAIVGQKRLNALRLMCSDLEK